MEFVTFEIAKKLKEKGFNEPCINAINFFGCTYLNGWCEYLDNRDGEFITQCDLRDGDYILPTINQVLKWLRNTRKLFISPCVITDYQDDFHRDTTYWSFIVVNIESGDSIYREYERVTEKRYETYEQAALAGIEYALDNLI